MYFRNTRCSVCDSVSTEEISNGNKVNPSGWSVFNGDIVCIDCLAEIEDIETGYAIEDECKD